MTRIAITGPESTGKSWLAEHLAGYYNTQWIPEFARQYLLDTKRPYTYADILHIAKSQLKLEDEASEKNKLIFCDTDFCVTTIWCKVKYNKCHSWITDKLNENEYELYLLCDIDLPWQYDPLREHPEMRSELFAMFKELLEEHHFNYRIVSGEGNDRLRNAIGFVDNFLQK